MPPPPPQKKKKKYIYIYIYINIYIWVCNVHVYVPNRFGMVFRFGMPLVPIRIQFCFCFSGNSNNKWRFDSLWCGMTDRCINASESRFWDGSERAGINPTQHESSGCDQLRFPCLSRNTPQTCAERSTSERDQQNSVEIKCHVAFHLPQQVISVHSSLVHKRNEV